MGSTYKIQIMLMEKSATTSAPSAKHDPLSFSNPSQKHPHQGQATKGHQDNLDLGH